VTVGPQDGDLRVIEKGLDKGERVIVSGLQRVRPGAKVEPKPADANTPAGTAPPPVHVGAAPAESPKTAPAKGQ
jgi:hypothetical protein